MILLECINDGHFYNKFTFNCLAIYTMLLKIEKQVKARAFC